MISVDWKRAQKELKKKKKAQDSEKAVSESFGNTMSINSESGDAQRAFLAKTQKFLELLNSDEKPRFGDRCPSGYVKMNLLGRGGNSVVWACRSQMTNEIYAVKQFPKVNGKYDPAANREIEFCEALFKTLSPDQTWMQDQILAEQVKQYPGLASISRLCDKVEDRDDLWLVYEVGQKTLHERLYQISREKQPGGGERANIYTIKHDVFFKIVAKDK